MQVSSAQSVPATTPDARATKTARARAAAGSSPADRSPSGRRSSASAIATASRTAAMGGRTSSRRIGSDLVTSRSRPSCDRSRRREPPRSSTRGRAGSGRQARCRGNPIARGEPRVSSRAVAASSNARATSVRLRTSAEARARLADGSAAIAATAAAARASDAASRTTPAQLVMAPWSAARRAAVLAWLSATAGAVDRSLERKTRPTATSRRRADGYGPGEALCTAASPSSDSRPARAPVASGASRPDRMASTQRAPNTMPSRSEFEASRFAPCTPVQATSPAAQRPGSAVAPSRSTSTPPDT